MLLLCSSFQELNLVEAVLNRLQTVESRFCGTVDQALPRLRGALPAGMLMFIFIVGFTCTCIFNEFMLNSCNTDADKPTRNALDELADLFSYLRVWKIEQHVFINALMPPTESYHKDLFFQVPEIQLYFSTINHNKQTPCIAPSKASNFISCLELCNYLLEKKRKKMRKGKRSKNIADLFFLVDKIYLIYACKMENITDKCTFFPLSITNYDINSPPQVEVYITHGD